MRFCAYLFHLAHVSCSTFDILGTRSSHNEQRCTYSRCYSYLSLCTAVLYITLSYRGPHLASPHSPFPIVTAALTVHVQAHHLSTSPIASTTDHVILMFLVRGLLPVPARYLGPLRFFCTSTPVKRTHILRYILGLAAMPPVCLFQLDLELWPAYFFCFLCLQTVILSSRVCVHVGTLYPLVLHPRVPRNTSTHISVSPAPAALRPRRLNCLHLRLCHTYPYDDDARSECIRLFSLVVQTCCVYCSCAVVVFVSSRKLSLLRGTSVDSFVKKMSCRV